MPTDPNKVKILLALDALYATQGIEGIAAEARGVAVRAVDAFYAAALGEPPGAAIELMERKPASVRWREWDDQD